VHFPQPGTLPGSAQKERQSNDNSDAAGLATMVGVGAIVIFPILYGCIGFVATIIGVWLYNVMAGLVGGIEMDVQ
jgi:hypothetical protein